MIPFFKKKYILPVLASAFLFVGVSFKDDFFEIAKQVEIFTTLFKELNKNYVDETNPGDLMDKAIKGMLASLDPYTVYYNEQDVVKFKINNTGEYTGIGALITRKEDKLIIREPYKNFPADKAGLKAGDEIFQIGAVRFAAGVRSNIASRSLRLAVLPREPSAPDIEGVRLQRLDQRQVVELRIVGDRDDRAVRIEFHLGDDVVGHFAA